MMKPKLTLIFFLLFLFGDAHSQITEVKKSIYFNSDQFSLKSSEKQKMTQLWESISKHSILNIRITGHTDNSADSLYNITLSQNRCITVENFFVSKNINNESITVNYFGENKPKATNGNELGKQENRRVDISIVYRMEQAEVEIEIAEEIVAKKPPARIKDKCKGVDTTVIFENGTEVVFNKCEYEELKGCLKMTSIRSTDELIESGLGLTTDDNIPLVTCGMFNICISPDCQIQRKSFKYALKVRFPFPSDEDMTCVPCLARMPRVFDMNTAGNWSSIPGNEEKIEIVNIDGRKYYEMIIKAPNCKSMKNCDCPACPERKWFQRKQCPKVRLKVPRKYELISAQIFVECPGRSIDLVPNRDKLIVRKRFAKTLTPCAFGEHRIRVFAKGPNGNQTEIEISPLATIKHRILFSKCKYDEGRDSQKVFGIFPARKRGLYRKYKVRKRDF